MLPSLDPLAAEPLALGPLNVAPGLAPVISVLPLLVLPPVLVLYRRVVRSRILNSLNRKRILEHFESRPGATAASAAAACGLDYKTAQHHARVLAEAGLLQVQKDGRFLRHFVVGRFTERERDHACMGQMPGLRKVFDCVAAGARTRADIAHRTGLSRSSVRWYVEGLVARGLAQAEKGRDGVVRVGLRALPEQGSRRPGPP